MKNKKIFKTKQTCRMKRKKNLSMKSGRRRKMKKRQRLNNKNLLIDLKKWKKRWL